MPSKSTMRVCEVTEFGGPDVLREGERPWPTAGPGEIVVEIAATNINPTDIAARAGAHRARMPDLTPPFVTGWDLAGVVGEVNAPDSGFAVGDRVVGMIPWARIGGRVGAYAQAAAVDPAWLAPRPDGLDEVTGATVPLNALTAHQTLDLIAAPAGATLLITGASGAVAASRPSSRCTRGLRVLALASDADEDWVASLGADRGARARHGPEHRRPASTPCSTRSRSGQRRSRPCAPAASRCSRADGEAARWRGSARRDAARRLRSRPRSRS